MRSRVLSPAFFAAAGSNMRNVAAWTFRNTVRHTVRNHGARRWASAVGDKPAPEHVRAKGATSMSAAESSLKEADATVEGTMEESEEMPDTVDITPQEIAEAFEQPTYEAVKEVAAPVDLAESEAQHIIVMDSFLKDSTASKLRGVFENRSGKLREVTPDRFVWDWWHIEGQYTLMRTPAEDYFDPDDFSQLLKELTKFGRDKLGCSSVSAPWLSLYMDGCEQRFHTDSWQGPWAFVLSLTDWDNKDFSGGETMIMKPHVLDYWKSFHSRVGLEQRHFIDTIEPRFNRLALFDPRFPHGVQPVRGTRDALKARLVIHAWFTDPEPFFDGGLDADAATEPLNKALESIYPALGDVGRVTGVLTVRIEVSASNGAVSSVVALTDTMIPDPNDVGFDENGQEEDVRGDVIRVIKDGCMKAQFSSASEDTHITVPFIFE